MSEPFSLFLKKGGKHIEELRGMHIKKEFDVKVVKSFKETGELMTEELVKIVYLGSRTGRVYSFRGTKHTASAPGESPASRNGLLMNSNHHTENRNRLRIYNDAKSDKGAPYSKFLEDGTVKMEPRPWFVVTIDKRLEDLRNKLYNLHKDSKGE